MTSLVFSDLSHCDDLERADAQSVRGGSACFRREEPYPCHHEPSPVCKPPHYNPYPPVHLGCLPVHTPICYPQPGHIVPL
ncbi:hypothetical protein [Paraburkholderia antibiotica]|uniref:Uncharacterized protein n=1 Tax=Paraburkholderia antibiotica TaxID=2728839 RepID=A0A7Y0A0M0_9BURK|nr:hypothetical protein [Paraburkholderia antibiotica]NML34318.1 hypothetical protein [Paraburkholderia antibiotica]